jgi:hypothetical protein
LALFELTNNSISRLNTTTFGTQSIRERGDLQRLLRDNIEVVAAGLMVIAEEFGEWEDCRRRIDLLAIDQEANLVVIEIKRTEDGGHMELQAVRYAAMISQMTFTRCVTALAGFRGLSEAEAQDRLMDFLGWDTPNEDSFGASVRIILVSAEFSKEVTTSVLWLNDQGLSLTCIRLRPYLLDSSRVLLDVQQIIPLPEADAYTVQLRKKADEAKFAREFNPDFSKYWIRVDGKAQDGLSKRAVALEVVKAVVSRGISPEKIAAVLPPRKWISVEGEVGVEEFQARAQKLQAKFGGQYNLKRYFCDDDEMLFRLNGRTYALSNQWSVNTLPQLEELLALLPDQSIRFGKDPD